MRKSRIEQTVDELADLNKSVYCDLGPGQGDISLKLSARGKRVLAVEAPWAQEANIAWAIRSNIKIYLMEFFQADFAEIEESVDCFYLNHAIAHFRYSPYILFEKVFKKLPKNGIFYVSTVNGSSFENVRQLFGGQPITGRVTKDLDPGFAEMYKDFNQTGRRLIWDDWMHTKEYTKPELEEIFEKSGFDIVSSRFRNFHPHWKKDWLIRRFPHLSEEIAVVGIKR